MELDNRMKQLLRELGRAINESVSESDRIAETIARIRTNGYDIFLMLDAVVALSKHNGAASGPGLTRQDRHFLKSLKIRLDEVALETEAEVEARPTITPQDVKFLRSLRISSDDLF